MVDKSLSRKNVALGAGESGWLDGWVVGWLGGWVVERLDRDCRWKQ